MIKNLITLYLKDNKRIILPEFGALIKKGDDNSIVFIQFLNQDDGVLSNLLCTTYGIETSEAQMIIKNHIELIKTTLADKGEFLIDEIGMLKYDYNGVLYLEPLNKQSSTTEPAISDQIIEDTEEDKEKSSDNSAGVYSLFSGTQQVISTPQETPIQWESNQDKKDKAPKTISDKYTQIREQQESLFSAPKQQEKSEPIKPTSPSISYDYRQEATSTKPKKKTDMFLVFAIIAALVALFSIIYGYLVENSDQILMPANTEQTTTTGDNSQK